MVLKKDGVYRFTEVSAAPGYKNSGKTIYVAFTKAMQDFGAKAGYTVTGIAGGATIQVENMPAGSLTIEKKVIGNNIPEETYEMSVTAAEGNTDTDLTKAAVTDTTDNNAAITPAISTKDGQSTLTFSLKAGHKAKVSGLPVGTYNVTENAASRSETDKTAYTASYSVDGNSVSNVKVKVAQDADSNAVPNVTVTNTYKTELKVLKKDIGTDAPLSGAQLAIYNNSDVTFDSEGKATVKAGATAVASWTSGTDAKDLTGKVVTDGNYVLVETAVPTSDYVQAAAIPFKVDAEGQIQVADAYANNYNDSTHTITLNNQKKTGSLTVKKIIEDGEADTAFDFTVTFTNFNNGKGGDVTVTRKGKEGKDQPETKTVKPDADGSLKLELKALTNNEAVKISGIPYGTSYTVTETQQEGYLETANSNLTGIIGDNGTAANGVERATDAEASITNTRLTGFTVKKLAEYGQYTPDAETKDNKQFKFKVTLTRNDAVYTRKFTIKYSDKEQSEEVRATNGVYEFTLKDTQSAAFSDLPSGTKYTVEEVADSDYDASVKVNNTVQNADSNNNADNNKNVAATAEGTIDKTGDTVEFTNARKLGAFSFTKTVKGNMQDKEQSYDFYVEVDGKPFNGNAAITQKDTEKSDDADTQDKTKEDKSENTAGTTVQITDGKLSLTDGQTATIANIPAGVSYSIKETTGDRYVTLINDKITAETTGTVEEGKTTETQFVNQVIHLNITKTDLTGEREVTGAAMTLYKAEDVNEDGTVKDGAEALDSWVSGKESFHDFGPAIKAGESYVLVETVAPDGYTYAENISFTVNADGTIKTDAEKTTDKETGEDVYLVKDDVTKVSIKKMDIIGNNEVAGARLLLKDKEGNVDFAQDFFNKPTNLTVSGQLNAETFAQAFRNTYTFGPTFRAENSNTARHAAEFWMIEPEMAFADLKDDMEVAEAMLKYVISYVMENAPEEMDFLNQFVDKGLKDRLNHVLNSEFGHVTYTEAVEILEKHNDKFEYKVSWGTDLQTEHERYLTEEVFKRPVFVTDYPKEIKAFYMKLNPDGKTVAAMDCLVPGIGEIIGGSQREDDYEMLKKRMEEVGLDEENYQFYLDLRKYGSTHHSGFGLGFERCVMYLTGISNIRDAIPFPRTVNNCEL